jgi:hypothetical protein
MKEFDTATAAGRLAEALEKSGRARGTRQTTYTPDGVLLGTTQPLIMVRAADIVEVGGADPANPLVKGAQAAMHGDPERLVAVQVDDLYQLLDDAKD